MAPTYIAAAATLAVGIAALFGKVITIEDAQSLITAIAVIGAPLFVMFRQWYTGKSTVFGARPE